MKAPVERCMRQNGIPLSSVEVNFGQEDAGWKIRSVDRQLSVPLRSTTLPANGGLQTGGWISPQAV
jgi:hypothetical protein